MKLTIDYPWNARLQRFEKVPWAERSEPHYRDCEEITISGCTEQQALHHLEILQARLEEKYNISFPGGIQARFRRNGPMRGTVWAWSLCKRQALDDSTLAAQIEAI